VSGATTYEEIARDLTAAVDDGTVRAILLAMDTPGGEVNGAHETAQLIAQVRGVKPIEAQVSGIGASAGYLLASATDRITTGEMGILGSLGVLFTHRDSRERDQKLGVKTMHIVSSQSPKKHLDPTEDAGRAEMQAVADQMAHAFLSTVARNRGVSLETVLADYGQGGVFVGQAAVDAGLADEISTYEAAHAALAERASSPDAALHRRLPGTRAAGRAPPGGIDEDSDPRARCRHAGSRGRCA
jgi:signal peptide peptidase SppA